MNVNRLIPKKIKRENAFETEMHKAGIYVMRVDDAGNLFALINDWATDLLIASPLFHRAVEKLCTASNNSKEPLEAFAGVWITHVRNSISSRDNSYTIGVMLTDSLLTSEYFHALCQASSADSKVIRDLIASSRPVATQDVARLASLFKFSWNATIAQERSSRTVESVGQELADSYEEISMLYTMTSSMNSVNHPERFVELACNELLQTVPYAWVGVMLNTEDVLPKPGNSLVIASREQQNSSALEVDVKALLSSAQFGKTRIAHGDDELANQFGPATIVEPIAKDGEVVGVLVAADKRGHDTSASSVDTKLLSATAAQLGIFLENALLYEDLNATFLGTLEALTNSIDAKDKYTCGHSQRVALLTSQLAEAAGLSQEQVDRFRIAGLVHDIGKIGVPESVLLKKGGLTDDEFESIKKHPEIGAHILRDIPQMEDILGGVLSHHEKFDGSGYPHGLHSEEIPLVARMISLADTFDAMSSSRTYRNAMTRQSVLDEMKCVSGSQFDPILADMFFKLDFTNWEEMMIEHQARVPLTKKDLA